MNSSAFDAIFFILGMYELVIGVMGMIQKKILQGRDKLAERYTDESLDQGAVVYSLGLAMVGLSVALLDGVLLAKEMNLAFAASIPVKPLWIVSAVLLVGGFVVVVARTKRFTLRPGVR